MKPQRPKTELEVKIDLYVAQGHVAALQKLADHGDKATAKYARRGLHILRTRGVTEAKVLPKDDVPRIEPIMVWPSPVSDHEALLPAVMAVLTRRRRVVPRRSDD